MHYTLSRFPPCLYAYVLQPPAPPPTNTPSNPTQPPSQPPSLGSSENLPKPIDPPIRTTASPAPSLTPISTNNNNITKPSKRRLPKTASTKKWYIDSLAAIHDIHCPLCYEVYSTIQPTPCCSNWTCEFCIQKWVNIHSSCPFCRTGLENEEIIEWVNLTSKWAREESLRENASNRNSVASSGQGSPTLNPSHPASVAAAARLGRTSTLAYGLNQSSRSSKSSLLIDHVVVQKQAHDELDDEIEDEEEEEEDVEEEEIERLDAPSQESTESIVPPSLPPVPASTVSSPSKHRQITRDSDPVPDDLSEAVVLDIRESSLSSLADLASNNSNKSDARAITPPPPSTIPMAKLAQRAATLPRCLQSSAPNSPSASVTNSLQRSRKHMRKLTVSLSTSSANNTPFGSRMTSPVPNMGIANNNGNGSGNHAIESEGKVEVEEEGNSETRIDIEMEPVVAAAAESQVNQPHNADHQQQQPIPEQDLSEVHKRIAIQYANDPSKQRSESSSPTKLLPLSRGDYSSYDITQIRALQGILDMLQVYCLYRVQGCSWVGERKALRRHLEADCPFTQGK